MKAPKQNYLIVGGIVLAVAGFAAGYFGQSIVRNLQKVPVAKVPIVNSTDTNTNTAEGNENINEAPPVTFEGKIVTWQTPTDYPAFDIWSALKSDPNGIDFPDFTASVQANSKFHKVGVFSGIEPAQYKGADLVLVEVPCDGPCIFPLFVYFAKKDAKVTLLKLISDPVLSELPNPYYAVDTTFELTELTSDIPTTVSDDQKKVVFEKQEGIRDFFQAADYVKAFSDSFGDFYTDKPTAAYYGDPNFTTPRNGFYLRAPDGTIRVYAMTIPFVAKDIPNVVWNDTTINAQAYDWTDVGGCGSRNLAAVVPTSIVNPDKDLVVAGKAVNGDPIYTLKDSAHRLLTEEYNGYAVFDENGKDVKESYAQFIQDKPMFFWKDPYGRMIKFQNSKFTPAVECGKPVIYLYPEKTTDVTVKLEPKGGFTYTEPAYDEATGWQVTATPDGQLTSLSNGQAYPYLFWEGRGGLYSTPEKGFVVAKVDVHSFLNEKLAKLGLKGKEVADFEEFWEPRMQAAPYYFVTFLGNREMDLLAPLTISPKPDSVIRVLMDFKPLEKPIDVQGYEIRTPQRNGFTAVEWGGVLR